MVAGVVRGRRGQPRADDPRRHERPLLRHEPPAAVPRQRRPHHPALLATLPLRQHVDLQPDRHLGLPAAGRAPLQLLHAPLGAAAEEAPRPDRVVGREAGIYDLFTFC